MVYTPSGNGLNDFFDIFSNLNITKANEMWPEVETAFVISTIRSASYLQITVIAAFFYWLFQARIRAMVDVVSTKLYNGAAFENIKARIGCTSLKHQLNLNQIIKKDQITQRQIQSEISQKHAIHSLHENAWDVLSSVDKRPINGLSCKECIPSSKNTLKQDLPVINILGLHEKHNDSYYGFGRLFSKLMQACIIKKYEYPYIFKSVLEDSTIQDVIRKTANEIATEWGCVDPEDIKIIMEQQRKRAVQILTVMHSKLSDTVLRICSYVFFWTLPILFKAMAIPQHQIEMIKNASKSGVPLVFVPLHRSHIDYIATTLTLCNNNIRAPLVAAGDNLRIPFFGRVLQGLGAFYIKRRMDPASGKKDVLYRAILQNYMTQCLEAGHNFEFFIEGGRTRTGKPCIPKGGLLSIFVDAYQSNLVEDVLLVPVSVNYEKIVEGSFVRELCGEPKKPETFLKAMKGIWKALTSYYGIVRVDFNQPFSLNELVNNFKADLNVPPLHLVPSTTSLFGTDVVNESQRLLVDRIARHIVYDCCRSTPVMSTNALSYLLLNVHRDGVTLTDLIYSLDDLRCNLVHSGKDTGFTGESKDVLEHAIQMLGPGLVHSEKIGNNIFLKPVTIMPNIIELAYYSNSLLPHFALEGVIGAVLLTLSTESLNLYENQILNDCLELCDMLQYEFVFTKSCQSLKDALKDKFQIFTCYSILMKKETKPTLNEDKIIELLNDDDDDEEEDCYFIEENEYIVSREPKLSEFGALLRPLIECYSCVTKEVEQLIDSKATEKELLDRCLSRIKKSLDDGTITCGESLSTESIKNCFKILEKRQIFDCFNHNGIKIYSINDKFSNIETLQPEFQRVTKFTKTK